MNSEFRQVWSVNGRNLWWVAVKLFLLLLIILFNFLTSNYRPFTYIPHSPSLTLFCVFTLVQAVLAPARYIHCQWGFNLYTILSFSNSLFNGRRFRLRCGASQGEHWITLSEPGKSFPTEARSLKTRQVKVPGLFPTENTDSTELCQTALGSAVQVSVVFITDSKMEKHKKTSHQMFSGDPVSIDLNDTNGKGPQGEPEPAAGGPGSLPAFPVGLATPWKTRVRQEGTYSARAWPGTFYFSACKSL